MSGIEPISAFNTNIYNSGYVTPTVTYGTRLKLKDLGIDVNSVSSEDEAKRIIDKKNAENTKNVPNQDAQLISERALQEKLRMFAYKIGLNFRDDGASINDMYYKIRAQVELIVSEAKFSKNSDTVKKLMQIDSDYNSIKTSFETLRQNTQMITDSLDGLATMNKAIMGL